MRLRTKLLVGVLIVIVLTVGYGAFSWVTRPPRSIVVADPGVGGERVMLGDLPANYFPGKGVGPRPAILLLGGSEGGLKEYRNIYARQLAELGYSVLYASYAETREDNRAFNLVPLEIFEFALSWLRAREDVDASRIGIIGHSKGAEAALLTASRDSKVAAVVAAMPSDVVWQGFNFAASDASDMNSTWSSDGKPLPFVPYILPAWYEWVTGGVRTLGEMHRTSWNAADGHRGAAIPIERINAPILFICGEADLVWPSCSMAKAANGRSARSKILIYPNAGHWAFGPAKDLVGDDRKYLGKLGGSAQSDLAARSDQWPKILAFLSEALQAAP